jgi:hypothetical protein
LTWAVHRPGSVGASSFFLTFGFALQKAQNLLSCLGMKQISVVVIASLIFTSMALSQSQDNKDILICGSDKSAFTQSELENCSEISLKDSEAKVVSFILSIFHANTLIEMKLKGNSLDDASLLKLKEIGQVKKIYLEKIELEDGQILCCRMIRYTLE